MRIVDFKEANYCSNEQGEMPCRVEDEGIFCCWRMTLIERLKVLFTGRVWMHVIGHDLPPMSLFVNMPFVSYRIVLKPETGKALARGIIAPEELPHE